MDILRLHKWLSQLGIASRRQAQRWMTEGRLTVNGKKTTELGLKVNPESDVICLDGKALPKTRPSLVYWMLCKPDGVITSRIDPQGRKTIYELPAVKQEKTGVFPVGRLDYHTEGLLLLSNDGEFVHRLMHPSYKLPRHYYVLIDHRLSPAKEAKIRQGVTLSDGPTKNTELSHVRKTLPGSGCWYQITVYEGRKRIVRRIFKAMGEKVQRLIRFGFGNVRLPKDLAPGMIRPLFQEEVLHLKKATKLVD